MKISHIMFAIAAMGIGAAQAQSVEHLSGASASRNNVVLDLKGLCTGAFSVYKDSASTSNLGNIFTAKCSVPFTGTAVSEARFNVSGGSLNAVLASNSPFGTTSLTYIDGATVGCNPIVGSGVLGPVTALFHCPSPLGATVPTKSLGGYLDVEGAIFKANGLIPGTVPDSDFIASSFQQAFGVAVSAKLYAAMQEHQTAKGRLPSLCAPQVAGVYTASMISTPDCQPSLARAAFAAMMANGNNQAKKAGANLFIGGSQTVASDLGGAAIATSLPLNTKFTLHRRVATSGTQAAAQLYFLHRPTGSGAAGGSVTSQGSDTLTTPVNIGATYTVISGSGSSNVITGLNSATDFAAGVLSLENIPAGSDSYRFVKINGQAGADGASQTAESIAGRYDMWFETFKYCPGAVCATVLNALDTGVVTGAGSPGIFRSTESLYTRNGKSTRPIVMKP